MDDYGFIVEYEALINAQDVSTQEGVAGAWLTFIDMLCLLSVCQNEQFPDQSLDRVGSLLGDMELMMSIEPRRSEAFPAFGEVRRIYENLHQRCRDNRSHRFYPLLYTGLLSRVEILAFLLAWSSSVNRKYERIYGVLQEEKEGIVRPTVGLCHDLARFYLTRAERDIGVLLSPDSFLNRYILASIEKKRPDSELSRPLALQEVVLGYILGQDDVLGDISLCGRMLESAGDGYVCRPQQVLELTDAYTGAMTGSTGAVIELCAPYGSGRSHLMRLLSDATYQKVAAIDMKKLLTLDGARQERILSDVILKVALENILVYLYGVEEGQGGSFPALFPIARLQSCLKVIFIGVEKPLSERVCESLNGGIYRIELTETNSSDQASLWEEAAAEYGAVFDDDIDIDSLVSRYTMNPGRIYEAVRNTTCISDISDDSFIIRKKDLEEQIRRICSVQFGDSATRLKKSFTWEDLKVDERSEKLLRRACERVIYRRRVNDGFGFGKKLPYGRGVSIVLYGPPGTGKTMAAQVIAQELGLDIYRIDLSQVSSKYIGETEKNLSKVFEAARNSNAILFFDEADALFSKRTEVSSSNDKYANAETSYLLQKIEEYSGVSVLATNNLQNFDAAFKRRITFLIPIEQPDEATRLRLWENVFPEGTPLSEEVDLRLLARAVELSGSNIKAAAVDAAYRAAAREDSINYDDIVEAVDMECVKNGRMGVGNDLRQAIILGYREEPAEEE